MTYQEIEVRFLQKAHGYLIREGVRLSDELYDLKKLPDFRMMEEVVSTLQCLNDFRNVEDDVFYNQLALLTAKLEEHPLPLAEHWPAMNINLRLAQYLPIPEGGNSGDTLIKSPNGGFEWRNMDAGGIVSELRDGQGILRYNGSAFEVSMDGGATYFLLSTESVNGSTIIDDAITSDKKTYSSKKIEAIRETLQPKETGKGLSTNDLTAELLAKVNTIINTGQKTDLLTADGTYHALSDLLAASGAAGGGSQVKEFADWATFEASQDPRVHMGFYLIQDATQAPFWDSRYIEKYALILWDDMLQTQRRLLPFDVVEQELTEDITVTGTSVGGITDGEILPTGTHWKDIFKKMLIKQIPPAYTAPTLSLSVSGAANNVEAGTNIDLSSTATYTQNDGGAATVVRFFKAGTVIAGADDAVAPYAYDEGVFQIGDTSIDYKAEADYGDGPVKNDNLGQPYPTGQILAGTATSNTVYFRGQRNMFYGVDNPDNLSSSIRVLTGKKLNPVNGTKITINIPAGTTKVTFAYPATLRDVSSVKYVEGSNAEVKGNFVLTSVNVEGANAFTAVANKVYEYTPAAPFNGTATYEVTI